MFPGTSIAMGKGRVGTPRSHSEKIFFKTVAGVCSYVKTE